MNINCVNNFQNFGVVNRYCKKQSSEGKTDGRKDEKLHNQSQSVDAQNILAYHTSFKGSVQNQEMSDKKFSELENVLCSIYFNELSPGLQYQLRYLIDNVSKHNIRIALKIISNKDLYYDYETKRIFPLIKHKKQEKLLEKIYSDERLYTNKNFMSDLLKVTLKMGNYEDDILYDYIFNDNWHYESDRYKFANEKLNELLSDEDNLNNPKLIGNAWKILKLDSKNKVDKLILQNQQAMESWILLVNKERIGWAASEYEERIVNNSYFHNEAFMNYGLSMLCNLSSYHYNDEIESILSNEEICNSSFFLENSEYILRHQNIYTLKAIGVETFEDLINDDELTAEQKAALLCKCYSYQYPQGIDDKSWETLRRLTISDFKKFNSRIGIDKVKNLDIKHQAAFIRNLDFYKKQDIDKLTYNQQLMLLCDECPFDFLEKRKWDKIKSLNIKDFIKLNEKIGIEQAQKLNVKDTLFFIEHINIYKKQNINEISRDEKKELLKELIASRNGKIIPEDIKEMFPILPTTQEEYCKLFPAVIRSLGIDTTLLTRKNFDKNLMTLGNTLKNMSDEEFKRQNITQEYSKDSFIHDVRKKIKSLSREERQKVYDYFGFELHHNKNASFKDSKGTGFSLTGYPANFNNGEKLKQIENPKTREVIEDVRENVIKFTKNNKIICKNKDLELQLNELIKALPELRPAIGCKQHGNGEKKGHDYDIFQHSLKVMQGIVQNPDYQKLSEKDPNDKKIMLLAALLHDITKKEGTTDKEHAQNSSFDAFLITKKLKLTKEEEIKLFTLIRNHEWLGYVNRDSVKNEKERKIRQLSAAYDLRHDNLFDMALMFTHADLKGVNDYFYDTKEGDNRTDFEGKTRSYGEAADFHAEKIKEYIEGLKPSQPLLPVTKIPKASDIAKAVEFDEKGKAKNADGIYRDKDGLIVIKYNELKNEDLEKIGFTKGSIVKGISAKTSGGDDVDTGNIKFFAHGLDYPNQLEKFGAFSLINSDVLLSASYTERPESKYRFFRPQGILLDVDTKYIHGGGETDSGSGTGKFIGDFKKNYLFEGKRYGDRKYISNLIKERLGLTDEDYIKFVKDNANKSFTEIEPQEDRDEIIRAFSEINSSERSGNREYNEMYISNPKTIMGVFAYSLDEDVKNPVDFLQKTDMTEMEKELLSGWGVPIQGVKDRTEFLRQYAVKHDIPFVVFGD